MAGKKRWKHRSLKYPISYPCNASTEETEIQQMMARSQSVLEPHQSQIESLSCCRPPPVITLISVWRLIDETPIQTYGHVCLQMFSFLFLNCSTRTIIMK